MRMQPKLIASAITVALLAGAVHAAENAGGGQPTSTPTHTVPVKPTLKGETEDETTGAVPGRPTDRLTIKTKSSPPVAPPIEDQNNPSNAATKIGPPPRSRPGLGDVKDLDAATKIGLPPRDKDKPYVAKPVPRPTPTRVGKCPMGEIWVQGPGDPHGHCELKPIPKD
jgi:hypothetical protein